MLRWTMARTVPDAGHYPKGGGCHRQRTEEAHHNEPREHDQQMPYKNHYVVSPASGYWYTNDSPCAVGMGHTGSSEEEEEEEEEDNERG